MTWNNNFADIEVFLDILEEKGRNLVVIIDPHIKSDDSYFVYEGAYKKGKLNHLLKFLFIYLF